MGKCGPGIDLNSGRAHVLVTTQPDGTTITAAPYTRKQYAAIVNIHTPRRRHNPALKGKLRNSTER